MSEAANLRRRRLHFLRRRRQKPAAMTVVEHLSELRMRLIVSLAAFAAISMVAFFFFEPILDFLLRPLCALDRDLLGPQGCRLSVLGPVEPFMVRLKVTAMVGLVVAAPVWVYELWAFVVPGLTAKEKRYALPFILSSAFFFLVGTTFAYLTLRPGLNFLIGIGGENLAPLLRADSYINFVGLMFLGFGLAFELPLLIFFLGLAGVFSVDQLRRQRRVAVVTITILAAVVTPSQDPYTMLLMSLPLYLLYEITIALLAAVERRRARRTT